MFSRLGLLIGLGIYRFMMWLARMPQRTVMALTLAVAIPPMLLALMLHSRGSVILFAFASGLLVSGIAGLWVIGDFASWGRGILLRQSFSLKSLRQLNWRDFEIVVGEILRLDGFVVEYRGGPRPDGGVDLIAWKNGKKHVVQCKHYSRDDIGVAKVRELAGVLGTEKAHGGIYVTTSGFTDEARAFAKSLPIALLDGPALVEKLKSLKEASDTASSETPETLAPFTDRIIRGATAPRRVPPCPKCGKPMILKRRRDKSYFWSCPTYPTCTGGENLSQRDRAIVEHVRDDAGRQ